MSRAPTTKRRIIAIRASGRRSATRRCGIRSKARARRTDAAICHSEDNVLSSEEPAFANRVGVGAAMMADYQKVEFRYVRSGDQDAREPVHHPVVVVGAGPVGLTAAIDLAQQVVPVGVEASSDGVVLSVETPEGGYRLHAGYVVACDGARSPVRGIIGKESKGRSFRDRFLIADVKMQAGFPPERWFWFDPPFHPNQSVLLHRQPDNVWRIDFQLGADANPEEEKKPDRVIARIRALLGQDAPFELEWVSVYT